VVTASGASLAVVPSDGSNGSPQSLIHTGLEGAAQRWSDSFEAVVMHAPPLLRYPEGWDVASHAAVRILVAPLWQVSDQQVAELAQRFRQRGMQLSGVVAVLGRRRARTGKDSAAALALGGPAPHPGRAPHTRTGPGVARGRRNR
jgi:hypothetical protein